MVAIPLQARVRKAIWDYLDEHQRQYERDKEAHRQRICQGRVGPLHGLDAGSAAMMALDEHGGPGIVLAKEMLQQLYCDKDKSPEEQALSLLGAVGGLRRHGPLRARMPLRTQSQQHRRARRPAPSWAAGPRLGVDPKGKVQTAYPIYNGGK